MAGLKAEINRILTNETSKIEKEKEQKRKEIKTKLASMSNLASEHINRGSKHSTEVVDSGEADEELMKQYDQKSESYENEVRQANKVKQELREEIASLEKECRLLRDQLADRETENKNLQYLID